MCDAGGLPSPGLPLVSIAEVEFLSLLDFPFFTGKFLSGAEKSFVAIGRGFCYVGSCLFFFSLQLSSSKFLSLFRRFVCSGCDVSCVPRDLAARLKAVSHFLMYCCIQAQHVCKLRLITQVLSEDVPLCFISSTISFHLAPQPFFFGRILNKLPYLNYSSLN
jgi:hypothetical protein